MLRTVALWVGLIVLFLATYSVVQGRLALTPALVALLCVPTFFVIFFALVYRQRRGFQALNEAYAVMCEGRVAEALGTFEAIAKRLDHAAPLFYIGHAQLLLWRVAEAVTSFEKFAKGSGALKGVPGGEKLVAPSVALAHALLGHPEAAAAWLDKAPAPPTARLAQVVLACRAGHFAEARRLLREHEVVLDQLGGSHRALCETLEAFVASRLGGPGGHVDPLRLCRESSVEALKPVWPELHQYVARASHGPVLSENEREKTTP